MHDNTWSAVQQQARVDQLKASIEADEAAIETAQAQLDFTTIRARRSSRKMAAQPPAAAARAAGACPPKNKRSAPKAAP